MDSYVKTGLLYNKVIENKKGWPDDFLNQYNRTSKLMFLNDSFGLSFDETTDHR